MRKRERRKELRNRRGPHEAIECSVPTNDGTVVFRGLPDR
jgi:hypothetical protein